MANKVVIDVVARFVDNVSGKAKTASKSMEDIGKSADKAQKKIDSLGKKKAAPTITADDSKFLKKIKTTETKIEKLCRGDKSVNLTAKDKASRIISKVVGAAKAFGGKTYRGILAVRDSNAISTINKVLSGGEKLAGKTWTTIVKIKDYALSPLTKIRNMLFSIKTLVLAITAGMAAKTFIANPIALADAYSGAQIGFSTLLGESRGQQLMDELDAFAKETPFNASQVIAQTQRMLAMGWDVENIIDDMETIGDAAAATGKGEMGLEQIVLALSQIKTKGRLSTEELNQLAEAGISAKAYLAEGLGYGTGDEGIAKMTKDLEDGAIASGVALDALLNGMKEYQGMMDTTANETVSGLWAQITDTFEINVFRRWGQGLQDGAKKTFGSVVTLLNTAEDGLNSFGETLYSIGSKISSFVADKLEKTVQRISDVTETFEFKDANLFDKVKMLWKGTISDPLGEWWESSGKQKTTKAAGKIGKWIGETLSKGIRAILGMTDILEDSDLGESGGMTIAQSFAKGFVEGFDASAVTDKLKDAISNVWNSLPWWGKAIVGGYAVGKAASGIGSVAGGLANIIGVSGRFIGKTGVAGIGASGVLGTMANAGYGMLGGTSALSVTGAHAALVGAGGIAGGIAAGASTIKGLSDLYRAYKAHKIGDDTESKALATSGATTLAMTASGAAAGAAIGSVVPVVGTIAGTLIGAGIGGITGWIAGNKTADSIRAAKYESEAMKKAIEDSDASAEELAKTFEKAVYENIRENLGDIELSMSEITRLADQLVWGDSIASFEKFTQSTKAAAENYNTIKTAAAATDKWLWKAGLGVTFNDDEIETITESFDEYIAAAQSYVENKHYEFTAAVDILIDTDSESGKKIMSSSDAFYTNLQNQLNTLGSELSGKVKIALEDGIIELDEQKEISNLQAQIAEITNKLAESETSAKLDLVQLKFGGGTLSADSFDSFMETMQATIDERMQSSDDAFVASVSSLKLQLKDGAITKGEYDAQVKSLAEGYKATIDNLRAEVESVELDILASSGYGELLGDNAKEKLKYALDGAIKNSIDPIEWDTEEVRRIFGTDELGEETATALSEILSGIYSQVQALQVDGKMTTVWTVESSGDPVEILQSQVPKTVDAAVDLYLWGSKHIGEEIDVSNLPGEMGIPESMNTTVVQRIIGEKEIMNKINLRASDFGIPSTINQVVSVGITATKGKVTNNVGSTGKARGGIIGDASHIPGYADGGIVRGGSRLVRVAEEGSPEMIIPLSSQRRNRALKLWAQAGHMMDVPGFVRGGITSSRADEGIRFNQFSTDESSGQNTIVDVGGITVQISVDASGGQDIVEAIRQQGGEIADVVAGILADSLSAQFDNTPTKGGAA